MTRRESAAGSVVANGERTDSTGSESRPEDPFPMGLTDDGVTVLDGASTADHEHRGQALYDSWSERDGLYDRVMGLAEPLRDRAFEALAAEPGESILDLGCGHGLNFERLRTVVGSEGRVVGLDYSEGMTRRAAARVRDHEWENVHVVRGDATVPDLAGADFDAALSTFALHTMTDARAAAEHVHAALRPGGRFVVLDSRPLQTWPARLFNPLFERVLARLVNHQRQQDTLDVLRDVFETVDVVETYDAGSGYIAVAVKAPSSGRADGD